MHTIMARRTTAIYSADIKIIMTRLSTRLDAEALFSDCVICRTKMEGWHPEYANFWLARTGEWRRVRQLGTS